ncbi:hypothetical protein M9435_004117 [Picochlorum sp. BPE23]|nr:hypothetical protein M9435_004117 [Picochlorum sp. BPE23]
MQTTICPGKGPEAATLGLKLVEWNFGPLCKRVVKSLVHRGRQSLKELRSTSELKKDALQLALMVLIQQNCVDVNVQPLSPSGKEEYTYEANIPRILQIIRIPLFLHIIDHVLPKEHREVKKIVLQTLFHHGRMTVDQIVEHALQSSSSTEDVLRDCIRDLVHRRLIERAPLCSLPPAPDTVHVRAQKRRSANRSHDDEEEGANLIARARERRNQSSLRFCWDMNEDDASESKRRKKKRKHEDMENASSAILWRVNFEECNRRLYNSLAIDLFEKHVGGASRKVVEAILYADEQEAELSDGGVAPIMHDSSFVSQQDVLKASKEIHAVHLKASDIKEVLEACRDHDAGDAVLTAHGKSLPPLSSCLQTNGNIRFRTTEALRIARHLSLLAIIEQRFGSSARRVWNMLYLGGQMEQKAIATESMLHNGEAREVLYAMLRNGFVTLQDVPRNADRAPSRTFYTWRAPLDMATIRATIMLYRTANNLLSRMAHETSTNSELLRRVHLVNQGRMDASQLNASQLHKLKATVRITESALIDIESQIAIFS